MVKSRLTIFLLTCLRIYPLRYTDLLGTDDIHGRLDSLVIDRLKSKCYIDEDDGLLALGFNLMIEPILVRTETLL